MGRYLERLETADREDEPTVENSAVAAALEKLRRHAEPECMVRRFVASEK